MSFISGIHNHEYVSRRGTLRDTEVMGVLLHSERLHSKNTSNFAPTKDFAMVSISKA